MTTAVQWLFSCKETVRYIEFRLNAPFYWFMRVMVQQAGKLNTTCVLVALPFDVFQCNSIIGNFAFTVRYSDDPLINKVLILV